MAARTSTSKRRSSRSSRSGRSGGTSRRERISPRGDTRFVRRDSQGQFKESDDAGSSLRSDRRKRAKKTVRSGHGDRGDQRRRSR